MILHGIVVLGLPDLGGCGRCFKQPRTPENSSRVPARLPNRRSKGRSSSFKSRPFLFLSSQLLTIYFPPPPFWGGPPHLIGDHSTAHRLGSHIYPPRPYPHLPTS
jgi:hypothetical protein